MEADNTSERQTENSQQPSNIDVIQKLQDKVKEYETLVHELSTENDQLFSQIKQLSTQVKTIQAKQENHDNSSVSYNYTRESHDNTRQKTASTVTRIFTGHTPKELSFDIEYLFSNGEHQKACESLTQMEYKRPQNIPIERFSSWLVIANKMKDNDFRDMLRRLQAICDSISSEDGKERDQKDGIALDDSLDQANAASLDKLFDTIEDRLNKILSDQQHQQSSQGITKVDESNQYHKSEQREEFYDENGVEHRDDHLKGKVASLKGNLQYMEEELQTKHKEVESLKERLERVKITQNNSGPPPENERILNELETEMKNRFKLETRLQEVINENDEIKEANAILYKENEQCNRKIKELHFQIEEKDGIIDKFVSQNYNLK